MAFVRKSYATSDDNSRRSKYLGIRPPMQCASSAAKIFGTFSAKHVDLMHLPKNDGIRMDKSILSKYSTLPPPFEIA